MSADRTEKVTISRTNEKTVLKLVVVEDGITVSYSVKTFESAVGEAMESARAGANRILKRMRDAAKT